MVKFFESKMLTTNTQDYNRYTYVRNNPLKYSDPSGWVLYNRVREFAIEPETGRGGGSGGVNGHLFDLANAGTGYNYLGPYSMFINNPSGYISNYGTTANWITTTHLYGYSGSSRGSNNAKGGATVGSTELKPWQSIIDINTFNASIFSNTPSFSNEDNYYGTIDMSNATAGNNGIPAQYLWAGNGKGGGYINTLQSRNNTVFLGDAGDNNLYRYYKYRSNSSQNTIIIIGHGNYDRFGVDPLKGNHYTIMDAQKFDNLLSNYTTIWKDRNNIPITVITYSCYTALPNDGLNGDPILQRLSRVFTNVTFIGPTDAVEFNIFGLPPSIANGGVWNVYRGGALINTIKP